MTDKQIIIDNVDVSGCLFFTQYGFCTAQLEISGGSGKCSVNNQNCDYKQLKLAKQRIVELNKKVEAKEQECERLKKELQKNFEEKDTLHLIIDRLLEASGYDTNTASAEEFEDVYEHMRYEQQQLDQLKAENDELKKANKHIDHNRTQKADKLMRIEKLITACSTCYTDEFIQNLLAIILEAEPIEE